MRMQPIVCLLCLLLLAAPGHAQPSNNARLDSLLALLPAAAKDTAAVKLLDNISYAYCFYNPDEGIRYAKQSLALAQEIGWRRGEAIACNEFGNCYRQKGAYPQALEHYLKALRIHEEIGNMTGVGMVTQNIGTVFFDQQNYPKALEYYLKSVAVAKANGDQPGLLLATGNIGNVYYQEGNNREALTYMKQALSLAETLDSRRDVLIQLGNIGNVYGSLRDYKAALDYYFKALRLAETEGSRQVAAANLGNIGETYFDIASDTNTTIAEKASNLSNAVTYLQQGIAIAREVGFNAAIIDFSRTLSKAYMQQGNYAAALKAYQQYTELKDSTFSLENNEKIASLETARALELKDKDIQIAQLELKNKRNERWAFIGGIALLLILMSVLFRSFRRQQHSNKLLSKEKKRSDDLLLNILPAEVAEELKETGAAHAKQYEEVSVLFTDFVDFTGTAEKLSPQALVAELNECFTAFDAIIERNNLEKIKTIGDAYMAVCGLPLADPLHATKTVQAAIEILAFIESRKGEKHAFEVRIGINSGPVVAGIIGAKKFAYDIWGDTVNTAARMEQHGERGRINISQSTYALVRNIFRCDYRGKIDAKHKGEVEMYFVRA